MLDIVLEVAEISIFLKSLFGLVFAYIAGINNEEIDLKKLLIMSVAFVGLVSSYTYSYEYNLRLGDINPRSITHPDSDPLFTYSEYMDSMREVDLTKNKIEVSFEKVRAQYEDEEGEYYINEGHLTTKLNGDKIHVQKAYLSQEGRAEYLQSYVDKINAKLSKESIAIIPKTSKLEWNSYNPPAPILFPVDEQEVNEILLDDVDSLKSKIESLKSEVQTLKNMIFKLKRENTQLKLSK